MSPDREPTAKFDLDPEALAWARAKVQREVDRMERFMAEALAKGDTEQMVRWRRHRNLLQMTFIGGTGCVIASFDERRPAVQAALDKAVARDVG